MLPVPHQQHQGEAIRRRRRRRRENYATDQSLFLNPSRWLIIFRMTLLLLRLSFLNCYISSTGFSVHKSLHKLTTSNFKHLQLNRCLLTWQEDTTTLKRLLSIVGHLAFLWHISKSEKKRYYLRYYTCFFTWAQIFHLPQALPKKKKEVGRGGEEKRGRELWSSWVLMQWVLKKLLKAKAPLG